MRKDIDILFVYNLVDNKGNKLLLRLGRHYKTECIPYHGDQGFRWSFVGKKIPMPVRSETWFNGFPEEIMVNWLMDNGWVVQSKVEMGSGKVYIYNMPKGDGSSKGNETYELTDQAISLGERALRETIKILADNGNKLKAVALYRYVHPSSLVDAKHAVDIIQLDG